MTRPTIHDTPEAAKAAHRARARINNALPRLLTIGRVRFRTASASTDAATLANAAIEAGHPAQAAETRAAGTWEVWLE